jgi:hypothetical protein
MKHNAAGVLVSCGLAVAAALHIAGRDDVLRRLSDRHFRQRACDIILAQLRKEIADSAHAAEHVAHVPPDSEYRAMLDAIIAASHES